jgi:hypothetical protein
MRKRVTMLAITAVALMAASCGDSVGPTEPPPPTPATQDPRIAGAWTGTYRNVSYECEALAEATFDENRGSVAGRIRVSAPCLNDFLFQGTFQENTLDGVFVDVDGYNSSGRGTVSAGTLAIEFNHGSFGTIRMTFYR